MHLHHKLLATEKLFLFVLLCFIGLLIHRLSATALYPAIFKETSVVPSIKTQL